MCRTHQMRLEFGETSFRRRCVAPHQRFADHETQDGVAQKLELLVVGSRGGLARTLMNPGFVRERPFEQLAVMKRVTQRCFQNSQVPVHLFPVIAGLCPVAGRRPPSRPFRLPVARHPKSPSLPEPSGRTPGPDLFRPANPPACKCTPSSTRASPDPRPDPEPCGTCSQPPPGRAPAPRCAPAHNRLSRASASDRFLATRAGTCPWREPDCRDLWSDPDKAAPRRPAFFPRQSAPEVSPPRPHERSSPDAR